MSYLYGMKCNKKPRYLKCGVAENVEHRRQSIQNSIRKEFGKDYLVNVCYVKEIPNRHDAYTIEHQIQTYLKKQGLQKFWNGFTVKSNGSSEWFYLPKGLKQLKKYIALGFKYFQSNPAEMPENWERLRNGKIFKKAKKPDFEKQKKKSFQDPKIAEQERKLREGLKIRETLKH